MKHESRNVTKHGQLRRFCAGMAAAVVAACASAPRDPVTELPPLIGRRSLSFRGIRNGEVELLAQDVSYTNGTRATALAGVYRQGDGVDVKIVILDDDLPNALSKTADAAPNPSTDVRIDPTGMRVNVIAFLQSLRAGDSIELPPCRDRESSHALFALEAPHLARGSEPYFNTGEIVCILLLPR